MRDNPTLPVHWADASEHSADMPHPLASGAAPLPPRHHRAAARHYGGSPRRSWLLFLRSDIAQCDGETGAGKFVAQGALACRALPLRRDVRTTAMMKGKARAFQAAAKALLGLFAPIAGSAIVAEGGNGMDSAIIFVTPAKFDLGGSFGHRSIFQKKRRNGRRRRPPDRGQAARAMSGAAIRARMNSLAACAAVAARKMARLSLRRAVSHEAI